MIEIVGNWLCGNTGYVNIANKVTALTVLLIITTPKEQFRQEYKTYHCCPFGQ